MNYHIDIQDACSNESAINHELLITWASLALENQVPTAELTIRLVDEEEMIFLNSTYRKQNKPTNVLSFPSKIPKSILHEMTHPLLGDVVICPFVLEEESISYNKSSEAHWAHIVIHGVLHLLGYDHIKDHETIVMQNLETQLLSRLGFENPYKTEDMTVE